MALKTGATHYHAQLGLPDKGRAIKGLVVCNSWDLEPFDLLNGLALGCCYQPCPLRYDSYDCLYFSTTRLNHYLNLILILDITANGLSPLEHGANATNWNFGQSFLFTVTIVTTIGKL